MPGRFARKGGLEEHDLAAPPQRSRRAYRGVSATRLRGLDLSAGTQMR